MFRLPIPCYGPYGSETVKLKIEAKQQNATLQESTGFILRRLSGCVNWPGAQEKWPCNSVEATLMESPSITKNSVTPRMPRLRNLFLDGEQAVRVGALESSFDALDSSDLEALLEAARLDPYPAARSAAISAAGNIGGDSVVHTLSDMFVQATEDQRLTIVGAWALRVHCRCNWGVVRCGGRQGFAGKSTEKPLGIRMARDAQRARVWRKSTRSMAMGSVRMASARADRLASRGESALARVS
jgi:hypothetical protein